MAKVRMARRDALIALAGVLAFPSLAHAAEAVAAPRRFRAIQVDVAPLRRTGDTDTADYLARNLPALLNTAFAPYLAPGVSRAPILRARVDSVIYGPPGSITVGIGQGAMDYITGAAVVVSGGRTVATYPISASVIAHINQLDQTGGNALQLMQNLASAYATWLPGQMGL